MTYDDVNALLRANALRILGGFLVPSDPDPILQGSQTLLMIGPDEPAFWPVFQASDEFNLPKDPMDHWSKRVLGGIAETLDARVFYPSDGPPYPPFFTWALKTGRCHSSPINLLVHDRAGMMVSFRGALALPVPLDLPPVPPSPCLSCSAKPCLTTCPVTAVTPDGYDVDLCKSHIATPAGRDCMQGCKARRACPVSQSFGRLPEQSAFHMRAFVGPVMSE